MSVRLAFAVTIQVDADVLLVDEVLAVGDAAFQQKCFEQFERLKREGRTIVFVTHDMAAVERFCDRAMLIERGAGRARSASPHEIARAYNELNFGRLVARRRRATRPLRRPRGRRRSRTPGSRTTTASASPTLAQGEPLRDLRRGRASTSRMDDPMFALSPAQRGAPHDLRDLDRLARRAGTGTFAAGRDRGRARRASTTGSRRAATRSRPSVARAGTGADADRPARGPRRARRARRRATAAAIADVPHTLEVERA